MQHTNIPKYILKGISSYRDTILSLANWQRTRGAVNSTIWGESLPHQCAPRPPKKARRKLGVCGAETAPSGRRGIPNPGGPGLKRKDPTPALLPLGRLRVSTAPPVAPLAPLPPLSGGPGRKAAARSGIRRDAVTKLLCAPTRRGRGVLSSAEFIGEGAVPDSPPDSPVGVFADAWLLIYFSCVVSSIHSLTPSLPRLGGVVDIPHRREGPHRSSPSRRPGRPPKGGGARVLSPHLRIGARGPTLFTSPVRASLDRAFFRHRIGVAGADFRARVGAV